VEDSDFLRNALARSLRREGLRVAAVPSALHALQVLDREAVAVVVADLRMPGPSGLVLLETVADCWPKVRRVLLTAYPTREAWSSPAVDLLLDKGEDPLFLIGSIVNEARQGNGETNGRGAPRDG
jgi:DNA-binding NtrC family response regulator